MNTSEQQEVQEAVNNGTAKKMLYTGEPTMTRGEFGESVEFGYDVSGYLYVWDSIYGWSLWASTKSISSIFKLDNQNV